MQRIALAINPKAGKGLATKLSQQVATILNNRSIPHELFTHQWPADFNGFSDVWIFGGDGTLNYFINHYKNIQQPLVIFKGGTGNDFAWKLYGNCSMEEQLELVLTTAAKPVDAASCNGDYYINGVGIGFDGEVLESMKTIRFIGGHIGYYLAVLKKILGFKESFFTIQSDEFNAAQKCLLVLINNSSRTGGGFHVSPKASVNDGLLDLVLVEPLSILQRFYYLPRIEKGKHLDLPFVQHITGTAFTIIADKTLPAQLDGELIQWKEYKIQLLRDQFLFRYR